MNKEQIIREELLYMAVYIKGWFDFGTSEQTRHIQNSIWKNQEIHIDRDDIEAIIKSVPQEELEELVAEEIAVFYDGKEPEKEDISYHFTEEEFDDEEWDELMDLLCEEEDALFDSGRWDDEEN